MTPQEIFNAAYAHVMKQGAPGVRPMNRDENDAYNCAYLTAKGLKCGVGGLMNAKELKEYGNYVGVVSNLVAEDADRHILRPFFSQHVMLLMDIQRAHDKATREDHFITAFQKNMTAVAWRFCLDMPNREDEI